jgi:hypothetical protein
MLHGKAGTRISCHAHLDIKTLALADSLSEMLIAAEDGVLGIAHTTRWHRPVMVTRDFRLSF